MMTIVVGERPITKEFQMHRGLLCFHSTYFKNLLDGPFMEGGSNSHDMPDVTIDTFQMFYTWLYTSNVTDIDGVSDSDLPCDDFIYLYVFADYYMVQNLKNRALELYFLSVFKKWLLHPSLAEFIYDHTTASSPLRLLHIDIMSELSSWADWAEDVVDLPKEFIADLFDVCRKEWVVPGSGYGLVRNGGKEGWFKAKRGNFCERYHDHSKREPRAITEPRCVKSSSSLFFLILDTD